MRKLLVIVATLGLAAAAGVVVAQPMTQQSIASLPPSLNQAGARACVFPPGGWTIIDCSNVAAATSAQLNAWGRYVMQCFDDSYFATGDEATDVADAGDGYLPLGAWLELMTTDSIRYVSCLNKNADSDCRILECK